MKLTWGLFFCLGLVACSSMPEKNYRDVAGVNQQNSCLENFSRAAKRLKKLVEANPEAYPQHFASQLEAQLAKENGNATCVRETVSPYGSQIRSTEPQIVIESGLSSLSNLIDSEMGEAGFRKYQVDPRSAYYDRMQVALAAHTYGEVIGLNDASYDLFFLTLKVLEK